MLSAAILENIVCVAEQKSLGKWTVVKRVRKGFRVRASKGWRAPVSATAFQVKTENVTIKKNQILNQMLKLL